MPVTASLSHLGRNVSGIRVDANISDLFFNTQHDAATHDRNDQFAGYDEEKLESAASDVLGSLRRLGVPVPSVDDLIADFYGRL